jgi:histidine ammonia-lyase
MPKTVDPAISDRLSHRAPAISSFLCECSFASEFTAIAQQEFPSNIHFNDLTIDGFSHQTMIYGEALIQALRQQNGNESTQSNIRISQVRELANSELSSQSEKSHAQTACSLKSRKSGHGGLRNVCFLVQTVAERLAFLTRSVPFVASTNESMLFC